MIRFRLAVPIKWPVLILSDNGWPCSKRQIKDMRGWSHKLFVSNRFFHESIHLRGNSIDQLFGAWQTELQPYYRFVAIFIWNVFLWSYSHDLGDKRPVTHCSVSTAHCLVISQIQIPGYLSTDVFNQQLLALEMFTHLNTVLDKVWICCLQIFFLSLVICILKRLNERCSKQNILCLAGLL